MNHPFHSPAPVDPGVRLPHAHESEGAGHAGHHRVTSVLTQGVGVRLVAAASAAALLWITVRWALA
ncbi:hypothetical protein [Aromatoleum sp.]|uniref:hypothetical protein n=1 Tax=Aromatoleum sp. TaxID=2307007 RepID=UPI002FCABBB4